MAKNTKQGRARYGMQINRVQVDNGDGTYTKYDCTISDPEFWVWLGRKRGPWTGVRIQH